MALQDDATYSNDYVSISLEGAATGELDQEGIDGPNDDDDDMGEANRQEALRIFHT